MNLTCTFCAFFFALFSWFFVGFATAEAIIWRTRGKAKEGRRTEQQKNEGLKNHVPHLGNDAVADLVFGGRVKSGEEQSKTSLRRNRP